MSTTNRFISLSHGETVNEKRLSDPRDKMVLNTFPAIKVFPWVKGSTNMLVRLSGVASCDQVVQEVTKCDQLIQ